MRNDFVPENIEIWIDNWKRKEIINTVANSWLDSFPFEKINIVTNHSSVTIDDFDEKIKDKIKIWNNCLRHDLSRGPITKNINQAYVHTFLSNKKYCIFAHDSYVAEFGWHEIINNTNYCFYSAPQGDGFHIMTLDGLKKYGWWDERYSTMGWHEIDYLARILINNVKNNTHNTASIVDIHEVWGNIKNITDNNRLFYNDCGLQNYIKRFDKSKIIQLIGSKNENFYTKSNKWHNRKWKYPFSPNTSILNLNNGPLEDELDWYPWFDINSLDVDRTNY